MCLSTEHANRTEVCKVGDLKPGAQYRRPDGGTLLVVEDLFDGPTDAVMVVDIATGCIDREPGSVKLGRDRKGRLYASRYLNGWSRKAPTPTGIVEEGVDLATGEVGPVVDDDETPTLVDEEEVELHDLGGES